MFEGQPSFSIGMVLRNEKGEFIAGMNKCLAGSCSVLEAEATGVQEAIDWVDRFAVSQVVVESDSLSVVNAIQKHISYHSEVGKTFFCRAGSNCSRGLVWLLNMFENEQIG